MAEPSITKVPGLRRLNGMDAMLLYSETPNVHTHTLKIAIVDASGDDVEFNFERLTALSAEIAKENYELLGPELYGRWMAYLPPPLAPFAFGWLAKREASNKLFNLPISNVAGPRERGHFGGAPVSEIYSVGPLPPGCGMNITVWSYVDQLNVSVIADDETLRDTHEVTDAMVKAFAEMRSAAGFR